MPSGNKSETRSDQSIIGGLDGGRILGSIPQISSKLGIPAISILSLLTSSGTLPQAGRINAQENPNETLFRPNVAHAASIEEGKGIVPGKEGKVKSETTLPYSVFLPIVLKPSDGSLERLPVTIAAVAEFANAMNMAGIPTTPEQILQQGLTVRVIGTSQIASTQDGYPLIIKTEGGAWREIAGFKEVKSGDKHIGTEASQYYFTADKKYRDIILANYDFIATSGSIFKEDLFARIPTDKKLSPQEAINQYAWEKADNILSASTQYRIPLRIHHLVGGSWEKNAPQFLKQMSNEELTSWIDMHIKAVSDRVKMKGVQVEDVDVFNEAFNSGSSTGDYLVQRLGLDVALKTSFGAARKYFGEGVKLNYIDNTYYGTKSNNPNDPEAQYIFSNIKRLKQEGMPVDTVSDHGHKVLRDFQNANDVLTYIKQIKELKAQYEAIGIKFNIGESDLNINGATPGQLLLAPDVQASEAELLGNTIDTAAYWGFLPEISWMGNGTYPKEYDPNPIPLMPFENDRTTRDLLYYRLLKALLH